MIFLGGGVQTRITEELGKTKLELRAQVYLGSPVWQWGFKYNDYEEEAAYSIRIADKNPALVLLGNWSLSDLNP